MTWHITLMFSRKVILRAFICALLAMIPFPEAENALYDLKLRALSATYRQAPSSVLVVEVSREDFDELRKRFSSEAAANVSGPAGPWREKFESLRKDFFWDDTVYAHMLEKILGGAPKRLLVTFFYNENLVHLADKPELQRLARNGAVLWGSQFDLDQRLQKPAPELTGTENYGFTNVPPDSDGIVRHAHLLYRNHISLPFRALLDGPGALQTAMPLDLPFLIRFRGPSGFVPTCRVLDLFDDARREARCGSLRDRYVILSPSGNLLAGATLYRTPVGNMSRGELLANILLTAKASDPYRPVGGVLLFVSVLLHLAALAYVVLRRRGRAQLAFVGVALGGEALLSLLSMRLFTLQLPLVPFILATAAGYFAFLWLKYAEGEARRWQAEQQTQNVRELDELKSNFLSLMSHDLKTPIAKVQALAERLNREASSLTDDQRGILQSITKSNEELGEYILSILNFQRIQSQEVKLHRQSRDVNLLIEEVVERLRELARERGVQIKLELEPMFPVEMDEQLMRQVLNNLIDNAIKYNGAGTEVTITSADLGDEVEVRVSDNGVGIEPGQLKQLFRKFSRAEKGTAERVKGTGLGLYLAKYFIELHGGSIEVESKLGEGATFRFRLPVTP
jgi:two-component system phosphate regulon sensor histidine kinase PhoR